MSQTRQELQAELDATRRELAACKTRVAELEARSAALPGGTDQAVAAADDIKARRQTEEALRQSAAEIHDLYNNAPCGYHSLDRDGTIVQINDTELNWFGYSRAEVVGKRKITDLFTLESKLTFQKLFPVFMAQGWINGLEFDVVRKDGSLMHILLNGTAIYDEHGQYQKSRSVVFDVTELRAARLALVESEARYRLLAQNVSDIITRVNADGIRSFVTPSCYPMLGYTPEEMIGRPGFELVHPDDRPDAQAIMARAIRTAQASFVVTQRLRHKAGHYVWVEVTSTILRDPEGGGVVELIRVIRDITERKRAEEALQARLEEERQFQTYLRALHEITIELAQVDQLDAFYKRTVELGLQRLGIERLSLYLYDAGHNLAVGTYGTDPQGKPVAEHDLRFVSAPDGIMGRALRRAERFYLEEGVKLSGSHEEVLGTGWNAAAILWNGRQNLGWLVADNLLSHKPASKTVLDILSLYALSVGALLARKQADAALRESEARYRLLADSINDVVMRIGRQMELFYVSPSSRMVLGYEPEELLGESDFRRVHPDDVALIQATASALLEKPGAATIQYRFRHKQGHYVWLEAAGQSVVSGQTGEVTEFVVSARDISQRKAAEAALRESEEKFRLLMDAAPVAVVITDQMGHISLINDQTEILFGYRRAELVGQSVNILVPGNANMPDISARRKDGSMFPIESQLGYIETQAGLLAMSFIVDITERKQVEDTLREQREFLEQVINNVPGLVIVKDEAGRFLLVNRLEAEIHGTTPADMLGKTDADFNPNQDEVAFFLQKDRETLETGQPVFIPEETVFGQYYQTSKVPLKNRDGVYDHLLVVCSNITERKVAEEALQEALAKEKELSDLKSRFVSMASHEFRTPLATILALTETLMAYRHKLKDEQIEDRLGKIQEQVSHLKAIMDDVLQLARLQARRAEFNPVRVNPDALCRSILDEFQNRPDIVHQLRYSCEDSQREAHLDRKLMRQILGNLVSNAIKYSPREKPIVIRLAYPDESLVISVRDEGLGIPEADLKHLFEPFHRGANVGAISGTGLGLVITKESVELHGGSISVASQEGAGTTVAITIPLTAK